MLRKAEHYHWESFWITWDGNLMSFFSWLWCNLWLQEYTEASQMVGGPLGDLLNLNNSAQMCCKPRNSPYDGCFDEPVWGVRCNQLLPGRGLCCTSTVTTGNDLFLFCLARSLVNCRDYENCLPPGLLLTVPCVMLHLMVSCYFLSVIAVITTVEYSYKMQEMQVLLELTCDCFQ